MVTFAKVLIIYQSRSHPSIILLYPSSPHSSNSFSRCHLSIFRHEYIIFHHIHPHTPFPYVLPPPTGTNIQIGPVEFYSVTRKNETLWFEGKWMYLVDIMLSEVSQAQKDNGCMYSLICGRQT
jgi:hypothetical protein